MTELDWKPDILGQGYTQHVLDLGADPDSEGDIEAVLVRRDPWPGEASRGVVLYVHGFSDYFFQTQLADFFADRGLRFYALDLRKCGRARLPDQTAHYVSDLAYYDDELDRSLDIVIRECPDQPVYLVAHSTGGLIVPLWLHRRRESGADSQASSTGSPVAAVALNSPWLDLQGNWLLRGPVTQAMRVLAKAAPFRVLPLRPGVYGKTLYQGAYGEWEFDTDLKPLDGFPVTFGWLNAIRRAHARLHHGIETGVPVLVLRSSRSHSADRYAPPVSDRSDLVLDTRQIGRWASSLGGDVTDIPVTDARHDVFLSLPDVRARAYAELGKWLDHIGAGRPGADRPS